MKRLRILFVALVLFVAAPVLAFQALTEDAATTGLPVQALILINMAIAGVGVQAVKLYLVPKLKQLVPWLLPILAMCIATAATWILSMTGIDIGPIGDAVTSMLEVGVVAGSMSSAAFAVIKEATGRG